MPTEVKKLITSFISGSSFPAFAIPFIAVSYIFREEVNFDYFKYSIRAPLFLGILSMIAKFVSLNTNISLRLAYFIVSIFSASYVSWIITQGKPGYTFKTKERWYLQYLLIFTGHLIMYNVIIYNIDQYLS